jgi:hypothetical protein
MRAGSSARRAGIWEAQTCEGSRESTSRRVLPGGELPPKAG